MSDPESSSLGRVNLDFLVGGDLLRGLLAWRGDPHDALGEQSFRSERDFLGDRER